MGTHLSLNTMKLLLIALAVTACLAQVPEPYGDDAPKGGPIDIGTLGKKRSPEEVAELTQEKYYAYQGEVEALACGSVDTLNYGEYAVLETPNFPNKRYPNNFDCEWELVFPAGAQLFISCDYFWVKRGDFFSVGEDEFYGFSSGFSGRPVELLDTAASLSLGFTTNKRGRAWGFRCFVDVEAGDFNTTSSPVP